MTLSSNTRRAGRPNSSTTPLGRFAKETGNSLKFIAQKARIPYDALRQTQKRRNPRPLTIDAARNIERIFGVSAEWLLGHLPGRKPVFLKYARPAGTTCHAPVTENELNELAIQQIEFCANFLGHVLPDDLTAKLNIMWTILVTEKTGASEDYLKTLPPNEAQVLRHVSEMNIKWDAWKRKNQSIGVNQWKNNDGRPIPLKVMVEFWLGLTPRPQGAIKPRRDLMAFLEILLLAAGHHSQSPLVAKKITAFFTELDREFDLLNHIRNAPPSVRQRLGELLEEHTRGLRELFTMNLNDDARAELYTYLVEMGIFKDGDDVGFQNLSALTGMSKEQLKKFLPDKRKRRARIARSLD